MLIKNITFLGDNTDLILVIMSVNILVTSLFVANKNFKGRALSLKAHYIELQRLYYDAVDAEEKNLELKEIREKYIRLLEIVENHAPIDDIVFRVFNESNINTRKPSFNEKVTAYVYKSLRFTLLTTLYILPIIVIYIASLI